MAKCGKGCMPECEYFTTGGCISPFNCLYKIETGYINSATSIPTYMEQYNGMSDDDVKRLKAEIADLHERLREAEHRAEVAEERLEKLKKTEGDLTVEEEINILENTVEEAKHRSFVFERELVKYKIAFDKAIKLAYKIRTDLDVLSCSSCEFGYAIDTCRKVGLYDDCESRWKEELLQQAEREIEGMGNENYKKN